uniref:Peptidase C1A papain C-terminal domain-containing protein n=1 Tax=Ananas comosus var. bracteatus TaxID=296719 RepID=A0A6V7P4M2_ANACO|nr:unnamed protein product [Ananas comosus var. bracteatus]
MGYMPSLISNDGPIWPRDVADEQAASQGLWNESFDLRQHGILRHEVGHQGECQCCYAFSSTTLVEAEYARRYGELIELSKQELVNCYHHRFLSTRELNIDSVGCIQCSHSKCLNYIEMYGIALEVDSPYIGRRGIKTRVKIENFQTNLENTHNEEEILDILRERPIAASLKVVDSYLHGTSSWRDYERYAFSDYNWIWYRKWYQILSNQKLLESNWGTDGYAKVKRSLLTRFAIAIGAYIVEN